MATVDLEIAGRRYQMHCRAGEEPHLRALAATLDRKARDVAGAVGALTETRLLLYVALSLADEAAQAPPPAPVAVPDPVPSAPDPADLARIAALSNRVESLARALEEADPPS